MKRGNNQSIRVCAKHVPNVKFITPQHVTKKRSREPLWSTAKTFFISSATVLVLPGRLWQCYQGKGSAGTISSSPLTAILRWIERHEVNGLLSVV
jgi:hypothetical protein